MAVGKDDAAVIATRRVQFNAIELDDFRDHFAGDLKIRIGFVQIEFAVQAPAVIRGHHPGEPVVPGHQRIQGDGVDTVSADAGFGRVHVPIPKDAVARMHMMVAGEPGHRRVAGRRRGIAAAGDGEAQSCGEGYPGGNDFLAHRRPVLVSVLH